MPRVTMTNLIPNVGEIASRLSSLRVEHEMSIEALSKELGVTNSAISTWERKLYVPSTFAVMRYSEYFGVSTDWILFGREYGE